MQNILDLFGGLSAIVLVAVWVFVPFALFGIKPLLRDILAELKRGNASLGPPDGAEPPSRPINPRTGEWY